MQPIGTMTLNANPTNYFAETEQVAFHTAHLVPGIEVDERPAAAGPQRSPTWTPSSAGSAARTSASCRSTGRTPPSTTTCATACTRARCTRASPPYLPNSLQGRRAQGRAEDPRRATCSCPAAGDRRGRPADRGSTWRAGVLRRPLHPGHAVLGEHERRRADAHRGGVHLRARQGATSSPSRSASSPSWPASTPQLCAAVAAGLGLPVPSARTRAGRGGPVPGAVPAGHRPGAGRRAQGRRGRHRRGGPGRRRRSSGRGWRLPESTLLVIAPHGGRSRSGKTAAHRGPDLR